MAEGSVADVSDDAKAEPARATAPIAGALFAANIGVFVAQVILSGNWRYALGMPEPILRWLGANASLWTIADNRFETLVTSCFLHGSVLHLGLNMFVLWQVGPLLERAIGSARFFTLYLGAGIVGSAASAIWGRFFGQTLSVGASGALCGLLAAAMIVGIRTEGWKSELAIGMARWLGLIFLVGLIRAFRKDIAQIDNAAHVGGALGGVIVALTWQRGVTYSRRAEQAIIAACVGVILASGAVIYVRNRTDPYLFLDHEGRMKAALDAYHNGRCDHARAAMSRAVQMDPHNRTIRELGEEIARECSDPASPTPVPHIRR
ncbi:MAG: rhomboid family intramembrane serine protease [Labilithrix sp.]|nr:rhomboid family intramembrane serine protease [Labilithrix sp.]